MRNYDICIMGERSIPVLRRLLRFLHIFILCCLRKTEFWGARSWRPVEDGAISPILPVHTAI